MCKALHTKISFLKRVASSRIIASVPRTFHSSLTSLSPVEQSTKELASSPVRLARNRAIPTSSESQLPCSAKISGPATAG
jgi:hypothetical protein